MKRLFVTLAGALCFAGLSNSAPATRADRPETVMVTFHAKAGAEAELAQVIANHWKTANDLKLVNPAPHLTLRGTDENRKAYFVEVFTWRDQSIPDAAPPAIQRIWAQMNALVEKREGREGLTFDEVSVVH